jgi:Ser/Thr protein kinase RdoA (MazF antagonist)
VGRTLHEAQGILYAVWPRTGGRSPAELSDDECRVLGRLLARIHDIGAALAPRHRPTLDADSFAREPLAFLEKGGFLPPACARRYRAAAEEAAAIYAAWSAGVPVHAIHGDCHFGNLLHGDAGWFFLDFDDFVIGPAVQDVWMLLPGRDTIADRQRALLIDAYAQFRPFDPRWLRLVEPLRALRFLRYAAWVARRWHDPAFPSAFPHFGTEEYWENETRDLEEQVERIARGRGDAALPSDVRDPGTAAPAELTNKDFFWDL